MAQEKRAAKPIITDSLSEASSQIVIDALDAGFNIEEIAPYKGKKIRGETKFNQENLDELVSISNKGAPIAGQSLMNSPDNGYPWEKPAEFSNPREALDDVVTSIMQPDAVKSIVLALSKGAAVADLGVAILYSKFSEGKINPDVMLMLVEPVMYIIMSVGEEANIKYNIEGNDLDELDNEDEEEENKIKLKEFENVFTQIKNGVSEKDIKTKINSNAVPKEILEEVKSKGSEIRSILSKGEK
tara:strand:+ start:256 stop:984 length:729 start_codon:yes stop_codon:yes gene_type:complete